MKDVKAGSITGKEASWIDESWELGQTNWNILPKYTHLLKNVTCHSGPDVATEISVCSELRVQEHNSPGKAPVK